MRVYCRIKPLEPLAHETCVNVPEIFSEVPMSMTLQFEKDVLAYNFDGVFDIGSSQSDIFTQVKPFVQSALDGENVCIFAYGQTGSGKTHTMEGPNSEALFDS
jgi:chromosomal replication initiation ATPase DnaA